MHNFKKTSITYLVYLGTKYLIDLYSDLSVSQTFSESKVAKKTLHSQVSMFSGTVITEASAANFSFTVPFYEEHHQKILTDLALDYSANYNLNNFDLYVVSDSETYKLEKCVIENLTIQTASKSIVLFSFSGSASKLQKFTGGIPGTLHTRSGTTTPVVSRYMKVSIGGVEQFNISGVSLELQNNVQWLPANTLHSSLAVSSYTDTTYPTQYVLQDRVLSGSIQQYVTDTNGSTVNTWNTNIAIRVRVGNTPTWALDVDIPSGSYTNRLDFQDIYIQSFDLTMVSSPAALNTVIKVT
jgi:hypothetical protein